MKKKHRDFVTKSLFFAKNHVTVILRANAASRVGPMCQSNKETKMKSLIIYIILSIIACGIGYLVAVVRGLIAQQDYNAELTMQLLRRVSKLERR